MKRLPCAFLVLLLAAPPVAMPGTTAKARTTRGASTPRLAGVTTIIGNETAVTEVTVPAAAQIRIRTRGEDPREGKPVPGTDINSAGRVAGFYLTEPDVTDFSRTSLMGVRVRLCDDSGCRRRDRAYQFTNSSVNDATTGGEHRHPLWMDIPAGRYLLYLFTDGAPVTVRLRFKGLPGSTRIRPTTEVGSGFSLPTPENSTTTPGNKAFWYSHDADFDADAGFFFGLLRMEVKTWSHLQWGVCIEQDPMLPPPLASAPQCPGGFGGGSGNTYVIPGDDSFIYPFFVVVTPGGPYRFGQYFAGVYAEADFDTVAFHMDLATD